MSHQSSQPSEQPSLLIAVRSDPDNVFLTAPTDVFRTTAGTDWFNIPGDASNNGPTELQLLPGLTAGIANRTYSSRTVPDADCSPTFGPGPRLRVCIIRSAPDKVAAFNTVSVLNV